MAGRIGTCKQGPRLRKRPPATMPQPLRFRPRRCVVSSFSRAAVNSTSRMRVTEPDSGVEPLRRQGCRGVSRIIAMIPVVEEAHIAHRFALRGTRRSISWRLTWLGARRLLGQRLDNGPRGGRGAWLTTIATASYLLGTAPPRRFLGGRGCPLLGLLLRKNSKMGHSLMGVGRCNVLSRTGTDRRPPASPGALAGYKGQAAQVVLAASTRRSGLSASRAEGRDWPWMPHSMSFWYEK